MCEEAEGAVMTTYDHRVALEDYYTLWYRPVIVGQTWKLHQDEAVNT